MADVQLLFPTQLYRSQSRSSNVALRKACLAIARDDIAGQRWSRENHYHGYTSYASLNDLTIRAPEFADLKLQLDRHVQAFARAIDIERPARLRLDSLWVNVLAPDGHHTGHIHPHSAISGTYYVDVPRGAGPIRFEDPRLPLAMASPNRKPKARPANRRFFEVEPKAGLTLLWESWLRHEVLAGRGRRISVSFNYS